MPALTKESEIVYEYGGYVDCFGYVYPNDGTHTYESQAHILLKNNGMECLKATCKDTLLWLGWLLVSTASKSNTIKIEHTKPITVGQENLINLIHNKTKKDMIITWRNAK